MCFIVSEIVFTSKLGFEIPSPASLFPAFLEAILTKRACFSLFG
jgi:hypothetical protein